MNALLLFTPRAKCIPGENGGILDRRPTGKQTTWLSSKVAPKPANRKVEKPSESPAAPGSSVFSQQRAFLRPRWR